jgi:hypothetical protein
MLYSTFYPTIIDQIQRDLFAQVTTMDFNESFVKSQGGCRAANVLCSLHDTSCVVKAARGSTPSSQSPGTVA